jgi:hypothetical protein
LFFPAEFAHLLTSFEFGGKVDFVETQDGAFVAMLRGQTVYEEDEGSGGFAHVGVVSRDGLPLQVNSKIRGTMLENNITN